MRPKLKPRTVFDYERLLAQHILPALGHLSVARIERDDVVRLHVAWREYHGEPTTLSPRSARSSISALTSVYAPRQQSCPTHQDVPRAARRAFPD